MDSFSKWVELYPTKSTEAMDAAPKILNFIGRYGCPLQIQSDRGSQFVNELITRLCTLIGTEFITSMAYSKEENGIVERANKEIVRHIRNIVFEENVHTMWADSLPIVQRIMNSAKREDISVSPAEIVFGQNINLDRGIFLDKG
jgi:transposase InsO family protein